MPTDYVVITSPGDEAALVPAALPPSERRLRDENDRLLTQLLQVEARRREGARHLARREADMRVGLLAEIASTFLPTLDSLELACASIDASPVQEGLRVACRQLAHTLKTLGLTLHWPLPGDRFDPIVHEALAPSPDSAFDDGCIVQVWRAGYSLGPHLLRPALVSVACEGRRESREP
jgi:molecular chaperone GrpE